MRSLRARLVLGLLLGITLFLAATGVAVHMVVEARLGASLDTTLEAVLRSSVDDVIRERDRRDPADFHRRPVRAASFLGRLLPAWEDVLLQAWDEDGGTLFRSAALGDESLPRVGGHLEPVPFLELPSAEPVRASLSLPGSGASARAMAFRFVTRSRPPGMGRSPRLQAGRGRAGRRGDPGGVTLEVGEQRVVELVVAHDMTAIAETLAELRWLLVLGWLVSSAGCAGIVSWLVHVGLRPLDRLSEQMGRHGGQDLQRRFDVSDAPRELVPVVDQLNQLMARIGEAFEREQAFASDAAHELRTPLAGLRATLELAVSRPRESEALRQTAEQSLAITLEMQALVETLLDLARMSRDAPRSAEDVDLHALLAASWATHREAGGARGLRWDLRDPSVERQAVVSTDGALLGRVIDNLVENAVSYGLPDSVLEVAVQRVSEPRLDLRPGATGDLLGAASSRVGSTAGLVWQLSLSNRVAGADQDLPERAFEAFWRADVSRSQTGRHAGLGLALCRRIIETLGGRIDAKLVGDRFTVCVRLPAGGPGLSRR